MCGTATIAQTAITPSGLSHTHVTMSTVLTAAAVTKLKDDLKAHINGSTATMKFTLPSDGPSAPGHVHTITLTAAEVTTLLAKGTVTGKANDSDSTGHTHTYTIGCA